MTEIITAAHIFSTSANVLEGKENQYPHRVILTLSDRQIVLPGFVSLLITDETMEVLRLAVQRRFLELPTLDVVGDEGEEGFWGEWEPLL